ncbi:uncharacterized protein LOC142239920 [Haematobia irritans]|uniref:uncharacterized protein LOC142239920 n=1 Tax=Haematobia irritans TaxID=7368 RepID=UPI003F4FFBFF
MVGPSDYLLNVEFMYDRNIGENVQFHIYIYANLLNNPKAVKFLDIKFNICNFLGSSATNPIMKSLMTELWKTTNMPYECPMKANYLYTLTNYSISNILFPNYTPHVKFNFTLDTVYSDKVVARFIVEGYTVRK